MIPKGLFTQIAILLLSVGIIAFYIKPTFEAISATQDVIAEYQNERGKVEGVNSKLRQLLSTLENIPTDDHRRLLTYMPDQVDGVAVMRDLSFMIKDAGLIPGGIKDSGPALSVGGSSRSARNAEAETTQAVEGLYANTFSVTVTGSYSQIKSLVSLLEENNYPLEVHTMTIGSTEGGFLTATFDIVTYAHQEPIASELTASYE